MIKFGKRITHDVLALVPRLVEAVLEDEEIEAVYLFGSRASGDSGPLSDIDIAFLLRSGIARERIFAKELELISLAGNCLGTEEVSVVMLDASPLAMRFEVIRGARLLFDRDPAFRLAFEVGVIREYLDFRRALDYYDAVTLDKVARGDIYG